MSKHIGATFGAELSASGLTGMPFSWSDDGTILFDPSISEEQRAAVLAVYAAHDPEAVTPVSTPPQLAAAAFGVTIADGDIVGIEGSYNILAALYLGVGQYMLFFSEPLPEGYFVTVQGDAPVLRVTERDPSYAVVEASDGAAPVDAGHLQAQCYVIS